ncbi:DUF2634 domain-containing protein [Nostoc sp. ChiQUE01b]|uniref:DUF2634 domain-containing protein n=1 Tax=Nostoc sp. ChiQUE01b TaxID=3075376 RepID=UPI002AD4F26F|nr:DUF2634 domain-containing protein [Nostoc sp. ChiQUE01b]MDZ8263314.1 DUF2634 domain-containing protein [Nostoc sp. ChiQUE01b]
MVNSSQDIMFSPGEFGRNGGDLATVSGRTNLGQAILNRFNTRQGELSQIGHPDYGSRLHLLMGEMNNSRTRNLAEIYIRECLNQESRIAEIIEVRFEPPSHDLDKRNLLIATIILKAVADPELMTIQVAVNLN